MDILNMAVLGGVILGSGLASGMATLWGGRRKSNGIDQQIIKLAEKVDDVRMTTTRIDTEVKDLREDVKFLRTCVVSPDR